jgi:ATP-binding cassette subfamily B protein
LVLSNVSFTINKGEKIGFIGVTGSGKSTLIDIIMGLLSPNSGDLLIDGVKITSENNRNWQRHISHVPQAIFLADNSISQNIAFGVPEKFVDLERVKLAAQKAHIAEAIECWPDKYHTKVGERGVRLSGGQRQRIGIARALYKNCDVLVFDEATSALDNTTETNVMSAIDALDNNLTVILIAHRLTTLKNCDKIIELEGGVIKSIMTYHEMTSSKSIQN